ncbi:MAG: YhbY family RNA-binding protein [Deltaproteobacteria bacterium]|jgi:RNA-binding protein|nr:YhbY family RNA-binding protein [Deltaproteobacteria bacterium]
MKPTKIKTPKNQKITPKRHPLRKVHKSPFTNRKAVKEIKQDSNKLKELYLKSELPELSRKEIKKLRGEAHHLNPLVQIGAKGITPETVDAIIQAIIDHQLIKVRIHEPKAKNEMAQELASKSNSILVGLIGHTVILYHPTLELVKTDK